MGMRLTQNLLAVTLLGVLTSCANQIKIKSDYDHAANFTGWKTYAWAPGTHTGLSDPRLNAAFIDPQVHADVNRELAAKGYVLQVSGPVDFWVSYHVTMDDQTATRQMTDQPQYDAYAVTYQDGQMTTYAVQNMDAVSYLDAYSIGTLSLRIGNPQTRKILWHGTAQARLAENADLAKRQQRLKDAIQQILDRFPPK